MPHPLSRDLATLAELVQQVGMAGVQQAVHVTGDHRSAGPVLSALFAANSSLDGAGRPRDVARAIIERLDAAYPVETPGVSTYLIDDEGDVWAQDDPAHEDRWVCLSHRGRPDPLAGTFEEVVAQYGINADPLAEVCEEEPDREPSAEQERAWDDLAEDERRYPSSSS